ncbi:hypothetical protein D8B26_000025 [Coccidioides posadasii str. Silveira]|uniref:Uncharacterized protein n=3 Tax=Coccidioides posadasii TaxID=199306 RepID=E9D7C5_COCPS|nr:conserved hypothetical protein [Coccidioides posadasii str. Silveira]KMM71074.1 hypothetical protein CPAG_07381 [Coccidioides posadasii RMSCC 3488]QVM05316.1 hypothetical protein D8B26_000025 [Coccidioides posadasii str. Silveira]
MAPWTPPANGSPCWIEIPVTNAERAKNFYSSVFSWTFMAVPEKTEAQLAAEEGSPCNETVALFRYPDQSLGNLGGGLSLVSEEVMQRYKQADGSSNFSKKGGKPGITMYYMVADLDKSMEAIVAHGGKKLSGEYPEGDHGKIMYAEDSEGNVLGIYKFVGAGC